MTAPAPFQENQIYAITRPHQSLLTYYFLKSLSELIFFPIVIFPRLFKYYTLRYRFDPEGISMSWGLLFRREINLTYTRIQDIHVSRGLIERWFGLATLSIQTASGSAGAEMAIQGILEFAELRDFLYSRMRGRQTLPSTAPAPGAAVPGAVHSAEALQLLRQIHQDLAALRREIPKPNSQPPTDAEDGQA